MRDFKPMRSLEDVRDIVVGNIVGMGQAVSETIPALCIAHEGERISLLGNMDNQVVVKYEFRESDVEKFYDDASIVIRYDDKNAKPVLKSDAEYESLVERLIAEGIWRVEE